MAARMFCRAVAICAGVAFERMLALMRRANAARPELVIFRARSSRCVRERPFIAERALLLRFFPWAPRPFTAAMAVTPAFGLYVPRFGEA